MTSTEGHPAYSGYGAPISADGWYSARANVGRARGDRLSRSLWSTVAVLGPVAFAVSLGSPTALGFPVRFGVLAAVVAAVGLLPSQGSRGWIVVALAVTGFMDALAAWIRAGEPDWALTVVMVLNALQSLAAASALLHETTPLRSAEPNGALDYWAYANLARAYQAYAAQYRHAAPSQYNAAGRATAQAQSEASAPGAAARADAMQEFADLQARYAQHGVGAPVRHPRGAAETSAAPVGYPSVPGTDRGMPETHPYRGQQQNPGGSTIEHPGP
jgi:hypothetical protein